MKPVKLVFACTVSAVVVAGPVLAGGDTLRPSYGVEDNPWSRPYVGLALGVGSGTFEYSDRTAAGSIGLVALEAGGLIGGLRLGYDQVLGGNALIGAYGEILATSLSAGGALSVGGASAGDLRQTADWLGVIGLRAGMTDGNLLYYAHGGAAAAAVSTTLDDDPIEGVIDNPRIGYNLGVGIEYAIGEHATLATEYAYTDFGAFDLYSDAGYTISDELAFHRLSAVINLRF